MSPFWECASGAGDFPVHNTNFAKKLGIMGKLKAIDQEGDKE